MIRKLWEKYEKFLITCSDFIPGNVNGLIFFVKKEKRTLGREGNESII